MSAARFDVIENREKGLRRGLTSAQLTMIAIGGAIGTGLFLGSSFAISFAGPAVIVSYAIGALIALLLMGCLAEMTVAHPTSGSFGAWAEFYVGPLAGYLVRYAYWSAIVFAVGTEVTAIAVYMRFWYPSVPGWVWIVGFSSILVAVNAFDVKEPKTKEFRAVLDALKVESTVLIVEAPNAGNRNLELSSRNIHGLELIAGNEVHPYHLLKYDRVIFSHPAIEKLQLTLKDSLPKRQRKAKKDEGAKKASAAPRKRARHEKAAEVA